MKLKPSFQAVTGLPDAFYFPPPWRFSSHGLPSEIRKAKISPGRESDSSLIAFKSILFLF